MSETFAIIVKYRIEIAGTLIVLAIGAYLAGLNNRRNRFANASEKFRNTCLKELEGLYPTPAKWPDQDIHILAILKDKFPALEVAVTEFRCHLSWYNRRRFDNAWEQYHKEYYFDYIPISGTSIAKGESVYSYDYTKTYHTNFKHNVDNLLKYAK